MNKTGNKVNPDSVASLIKAYFEGDVETRNRIISSCMPHAERLAHEYLWTGADEDDLVQSAYEGLVEGVDDFLSDRTENFFMYITRRINWKIRAFVVWHMGFYDKGDYHDNRIFTGQLISILKAKRDLIEEGNANPGLKELSNRTGFYELAIYEAIKEYEHRRGISIDEVDFVDCAVAASGVSDVEAEVVYGTRERNLDKIIECANLTPGEVRVLECISKGIFGVQQIADMLEISKKRTYLLRGNVYSKLGMARGELGRGFADVDVKNEAIEAEKMFVNRRMRDRQNNKYRH